MSSTYLNDEKWSFAAAEARAHIQFKSENITAHILNFSGAKLMRHDHPNFGLGTLFSTLTALASPGHTALTGKPLYGNLPPLGVRSRAGGRLARIGRTLALWHERSRQRRHVVHLNDHLLRDIGLTRADIDAERQKRFWQA
jgi:uncharacterized protein YjiS (DUF1127 family)